MNIAAKQFSMPVFFFAVVAAYLYPLIPICLLWFVPQNRLSYFLITITGCLVAFSVALWAIRNDNLSYEEIGWSPKHLRQALVTLLIGWAIFAAIIVTTQNQIEHPLNKAFQSSPLSILKHWLFVGLAEELLFRGYILKRLVRIFSRAGKLWPSVVGVLVSSLLFATFHIPQRLFVIGMSLDETLRNMLPLFLIGVLLGWLFLRSRNVILVGFIHGGINAPLLGQQSNLVPLMVFTIVIEVTYWINKPIISS